VFELTVRENGFEVDNQVFDTYDEACSFNRVNYLDSIVSWKIFGKPLYFKQRIYIFHTETERTREEKIRHYLLPETTPSIIDVVHCD